MATGPRKGLNPARKVGSGPNNEGLSHYTIASGYATSLGIGDPVKLTTDGSIILNTAGGASVGVFQGCNYVDAGGRPSITKYWPASTVPQSGTIDAIVVDDPLRTFLGTADGTVARVIIGDIFNMDLVNVIPDIRTGRSQAVINVLPSQTGNVALALTDVLTSNSFVNAETFTVSTSAPGSTVTTITIHTGDTFAVLLAAINATNNVAADRTLAGYLRLRATDGYSLITANTSGDPLVDAGITAGTTTRGVAYSAGMVKVINVIDTVNNVLEVVLVNDPLRAQGATA